MTLTSTQANALPELDAGRVWYIAHQTARREGMGVEDAEDIAQGVALEMEELRNAGRYVTESFVAGRTQLRSLNWARDASRRQARDGEYLAAATAETSGARHTPCRPWQHGHPAYGLLAREVHQLLFRLPEPAQSVLRALYFLGWPIRDVMKAQRMGLPMLNWHRKAGLDLLRAWVNYEETSHV